jgi:hypothetical protein
MNKQQNNRTNSKSNTNDRILLSYTVYVRYSMILYPKSYCLSSVLRTVHMSYPKILKRACAARDVMSRRPTRISDTSSYWLWAIYYGYVNSRQQLSNWFARLAVVLPSGCILNLPVSLLPVPRGRRIKKGRPVKERIEHPGPHLMNIGIVHFPEEGIGQEQAILDYEKLQCLERPKRFLWKKF